MGTKHIGAPQGSGQIPVVPPGFSSHTSFTLERIRDDDGIENTQVRKQSGVFDEGAFRKALERKPWLSFGMLEENSDESSDSEVSEHDFPSRKYLPKGIIRGCSTCQNCQKVVARWRPEEACRPTLDEAPTFYPSEEEFKDTVKYIAGIRPLAEPYGICRIVPPPSWKPPCPLKEKNIWKNTEFATHIQSVDKLLNRQSLELLTRDLKISTRKRQRTSSSQGEQFVDDRDFRETNNPGYYSNINSELGDGPRFTLEAFEKYADDFVGHYFCSNGTALDSKINRDYLRRGWKPSTSDVEGEYWRIIEKATEEIEILFGTNIETNKFSSGFPRFSSGTDASSEDEYLDSGWNLNNTPHQPGSLLMFESGDIPGVLIPSLHVGMCFSSILWHVEPHYLYSLSYLHLGAPKVCYGVSERHALKLEGVMKKHLSTLSSKQPYLLRNQVAQFSPSLLKSEGVPVYSCVQHVGEYVLTFPQAYHCGFSCGFNCVESVNFAPIDWLSHGQNAVEAYRDQKCTVTISFDKLLLGAAREAVRAQWNILLLKKSKPDDLVWRDVCGQEKMLSRALKARIDTESKRRDFFSHSLQSRKMNCGLDGNTDRRCVICHYDLHLSAVGCLCSPDKFACLNHANQICQCEETMKFVLFRYAINELNTLADALVPKLSAVHKWGISDLGFSLISRASKLTDKEQELVGEASSADSLPLGGDGICSNLQKKPSTGLAPGSQSLLLSQERILDKSTTLRDGNIGATSISTSEIVIAQRSSDTGKDHIAIDVGCKHGKMDVDKKQSVLESAHGSLNIANLQKNLTVTKVVQRINCTVELLHYGTIIPERLWSTSQAIFPKGYKSRVRYLDVKKPSEMCYYTSEILDAGRGAPLFMVQVEQCASEVFIHMSAAKCWDMVREKVNQEIRRQHSLGEFNVPRPQPPDSVNGLQMFGLTSPTIAQAIEAFDTGHVCTEYWKARLENKNSSLSTEPGAKEPNIQLLQVPNTALRSLLKKANTDELDVLHQVLTADQPRLKMEAVQILKDEISSRSSTPGKP